MILKLDLVLQQYIIPIINKPYPYLFYFKRNLGVAMAIGLLISMINWFALDIDQVNSQFILSKIQVCTLAGLSSFCSILFITELVPRLFFNPITREHWTIGKEFLLIVSLLFFIAVCNNIMAYIIEKEHHNTNLLLKFINASFYVVAVGSLPTFLIVWFNYTIILKQNLKEVSLFNEELQRRIDFTKNSEGDVVRIQTNNKTELIELDTDKFLFAKADGNYIDLYSKSTNGVACKPYRIGIQTLENALDKFPFIICTHRSYVVNIKNIKATAGNARNYRIIFNGVKEEVPVSRNKFQVFKEAFHSEKV
ncbi:LytTR family DNA-binding domain-containing protein [Zhouia amylolytica]|uniref:LytTR family DNA-binding domain-containing protein n=1 Tax=Zhouia amylolytica TaxID=376730 RepID=UPI0004AE85A4|nr:LytTR family DNA-binding domain-containing protein [Zhouia amylolytica]